MDFNRWSKHRVTCHGCGQKYDQNGAILPTICGACGSADVEVWSLSYDGRDAQPASVSS